MTAPAPGDERAAAARIHRLAIPTPFLVGRVNAYLIEDEPLTLLDTGPNSGLALDELERALAAHGHAMSDLGMLVVSHQHIDHLGLVDIVARRSGAEVVALAGLDSYLESFSERAEADDAFAEAIMRRHGVPGDVATALRAVTRGYRGWGASARVDRTVHDGDVLALRDRRLQVAHRPGHSPSDTVLWDAERRILLAADHLIGHISSNPLISLPLDVDALAPDDRPHALEIYLESMRRTRELAAELVLPGHGDPVEDHRALIDDRFRMHARRATRIAGLIAEHGPVSAFELAQVMWGKIALTQTYLTLSEVLGHVDLLVADGRVVEDGTGEVVRYRTGEAAG